MAKRRKNKNKNIILVIFIIIIIIAIAIFIPEILKKETVVQTDETKMIDLREKSISDVNFYAEQYKLNLTIEYAYSDQIPADKVISQSIASGNPIKENDNLIVVFSKGKVNKEQLKADNINELGKIPVMMYHGIVNVASSSTGNTGGNVDKSGYDRTSEAFREDLEFYYKEGYQMIRLIDYVNQNIDVAYSKSPLVLTFDDGKENNIKVTGLDEAGNIIIDENSAVGILESFKKKYPDYNVTATFFINSGLFNQPEYNEKIIKWLVNNNYDIGNHTRNHVDFKTVTSSKTEDEVGYMYQKLEELIPGKYVNIVALPFGSPYSTSHENFSHILNGSYNDITYETVSTLRVGWEADASPYDVDFDKTFIKRIRAYDHDGTSSDIKMNFNILKTKKYISDGDVNTVVIPEKDKDRVITTNKTIITY
ncbi:MAG: polysaccharide deacetylase family protein [bacterium]|nr:polysaccharide deacetylase family protein [bacterium]